MNIQWYPGHMTKTRRQIEADLKLVDMLVEVIDARIPVSSRNPDIDQIAGSKPRLIVLNRADQADPGANRRWTEYFRSRGYTVLETDAKSGTGVNRFSQLAQHTLREQIARWREKGQVGRPVRAMVVGIPNVGKSTFINKVAKRKSAKAGDRPGVTRGKQWVTVDSGLLLLDTPGILWPRFEDPQVGIRLVYTGAVKDDVLDIEGLACHLMAMLWKRYPDAVRQRYKVDLPPEAEGYDLLEAAGRKRGFLISGGEIDTERMARVLLEEYRSCKLGRFTLEGPESYEEQP